MQFFKLKELFKNPPTNVLQLIRTAFHKRSKVTVDTHGDPDNLNLTTVPEAQFRRLENLKLAFATATSNSDRSPQKVAQHDGIISWKIDYRTEI